MNDPRHIMTGPGGIVVENVIEQKDSRRPPTPMLQSTRGPATADCCTAAQVAKLVDLARLTPR
jgi:hypothetical protein